MAMMFSAFCLKSIRLFGSVFVALGLSAASGLAADVTLKIHHFLDPESAPQKLLLEPWAERIETASDGRISVEIHPDMKLGGKAPELIEQVEAGTVDIVWTAAAYTPGRFARSEVFTLPLVHVKDAAKTNRAIQQMLGKELAGDYAGLHPLLVHVHAGHAFHTAYKPIKTLNDFIDLSIRPPGRGIGLWTVEALGAVPATKRHPRLAHALTNQMLDGVLMPFDLARSMEVVSAARHHTLLQDGYFGTSLYIFAMNKARYQSLPDDLRKIIDDNSGYALAGELGQKYNEASRCALAEAETLGHSVDELNGEAGSAVVAALETVGQRWVAESRADGIDGASLIEKARAAIAADSGLDYPDACIPAN